MSGAAVGDLTNSALYKMYEITGSCRRWPRMSKPLMSSVTEPPLHSCGEVRHKVLHHSSQQIMIHGERRVMIGGPLQQTQKK